MKLILAAISALLLSLVCCTSEKNPVNSPVTEPLSPYSENGYVQYEKYRDYGPYCVVGGDMVLDKSDSNHMQIIQALSAPAGSANGASLAKSAGLRECSVPLWPNGEIPYKLASSFSAEEKEAIQYCLDSFMLRCNINFYPSTSSNNSYVLQINNDAYADASMSTVGYTRDARTNLYSYQCDRQIYLHELMHVLGFAHEHQREDRPITVYVDNIKEQWRYAWAVIPKFWFPGTIFATPRSTTIGPYDYWSVTHYDQYGGYFAVDYYKPVIDAPGYNNVIGQPNGPYLSPGDANICANYYNICKVQRIVPVYRSAGNELRGQIYLPLLSDVTAFQIEGERIAALRTDGWLFGKDGTFGGWAGLQSGTKRFWLSGNRIGALLTNGTLRVKDGLNTAWTDVHTSVADFRLDGNRIAILLTDGRMRAKDGIGGAWVDEISGVKGIGLAGNRIGALLTNGLLKAKDGLNGGWVDEISNVQSFQLHGDRIAALVNGTLYAKDGLSGAWRNEISGVQKFQLDGNRIAVLASGNLLAKDGLDGAWAGLMSNVYKFYLFNDYVAALSGVNFYTKAGLHGAWRNRTICSDRNGQFPIAAMNPVDFEQF